MVSRKSTQEFNEKNSIYFVIFNYIVRNSIQFNGRYPSDLSKNHVKKYIEDYGVILNSNKIFSSTTKIEHNDEIVLDAFAITFTCIKDSNYGDFEEINVTGELDMQITNYLKTKIGTSEIHSIKPDKIKLAFASIICLFQEYGFEKIKTSEFSYDLTNFIKAKSNISNIIKELHIAKSDLNFGGKLIEILLQGKADKEDELRSINRNLLSGHYDMSTFKYLQDYRRLSSSDSFQYLINPLLNNSAASPLALENLLKLVNKSLTAEGIESKFHHYEESKPIFQNYFQILNDSDEYCNEFFHPIAEHLFKLLKENCQTAVEKSAKILIEKTNRKYNFSNKDRLEQEIFLTITNEGEGLAKGVSIASLSEFIHFNKIIIGLLKPKEKREISVIASIKFSNDFKSELPVIFEWEELSGKHKSGNETVFFELQQTEIPWEELKKKNPYSNSIIENKEQLFGREEILDELKSNILSDNIESYKLWGQKRVGKSSIVKTLKSIFDSEEKVIIVYRSLGGLKNTDPVITLNSLGESLCTEVYEEVDRKIKNTGIRERLRSINVPQFNGSLFPLESYIKQLRRVESSLRFVFILDEFDRINEEFFLPGNLGETLSLSLGKGLNEYKYIGFILVGSENMHLLDRHGINYNSFQEREVDTFHKLREYNSFIQIVKGPVSPFLNYSDEAIDKIFNVSNGNPYFANLICSNIFKNAYKFKDNEVDAFAVTEAISLITNSSQKSHFEHYWSDGITEESNIKKERKADIRRRILVSFSMSSNPSEQKYPTRSEIARNFKKPLETEYEFEKYEVENTITEFSNRKIFIENKTQHIRILPELFESWLCGTGRTLMIEGVSDLQALQREIDLENELALKPDEINRLSENYHFQEKVISPDVLTQYFKQFGSASKQRRVFKLIDSIFFISKRDILEFYRKESRNIFTKTEISLKERARTIFREDIELYTFSKYYPENGSVVETFKLMNHIRPQKQLKNIKNEHTAWKRSKADEIIIIEPIINNISEIQSELFLLLNDVIKATQISIRLITLVITTKAKADIISATSTFANFKLIAFKEVEETKIKPFIQGTELFENEDEANQAFYEVRNHFPGISKDTLLVLFEDYCPSKSCPVLWFKSSEFQPLFFNEHGVLDTINEYDEGERRRDRLYMLVKEMEQTINRYLINYLKNKAEKEGEPTWCCLKYIPRKTFDNINKKWLDELQKDPIESYFDFIDYKEIVLFSKDKELQKKFNIDNRYDWMDKCNILRRDHSHPVKPAPLISEIEYFEQIKNQILPRL